MLFFYQVVIPAQKQAGICLKAPLIGTENNCFSQDFPKARRGFTSGPEAGMACIMPCPAIAQ